MTIVAIWSESETLWSVSDTRISTFGRTDHATVLLDSVPKLNALPVSCRTVPTDASIMPIPYYATTVGYAFAGSTLIATTVFATASACLQNLTTTGPKNPPELKQVAELVKKLADRTIDEFNSESSGVELCIFGWCPHRSRFEIYTMKRRRGEDPTKWIEVIPDTMTEPVLLGNGAGVFRSKQQEILANGDIYGRSGRTAKLTIEKMIRDKDVLSVGGSVFIGIATRFGYNLYWHAEPIEYGKPAAKRNFAGLDLDKDLGPIGHFVVGMAGMV